MKNPLRRSIRSGLISTSIGKEIDMNNISQINNEVGKLPLEVLEADIGGMQQFVVNARPLHTFLKVGRDFTTWIKQRISKYKFVENEDFKVFTNSGENLLGGRPSTEYLLTLDVAKELCIVKNNHEGREARRYFIHCEKLAQEAIKEKPLQKQVKFCSEIDLCAVHSVAYADLSWMFTAISHVRKEVQNMQDLAMQGKKLSEHHFSDLLEHLHMYEYLADNRMCYHMKQSVVLERAGYSKE